MLHFVEAEVRQQIDKRLNAKGWTLDPEHPGRDVFIERSLLGRLGPIQRENLEDLSPDYVFFSDNVPVAVLEAKKPRASLYRAFEQGIDYAERIGCDFVFACNGPTFKSLHMPSGKPMFVNEVEVTEPLAPHGLRRFCKDRTNMVFTVPQQVIKSRSQLIDVFESLNNVLRQAGLRAGLERFTEFANILFLKLLSERDEEDETWADLLNAQADALPEFLNGFIIDQLRQRYESEVLSKTQVNGSALKRIIHELNPLHLMNVDEDLKGVAFEHFLSRTTQAHNDLGEYFTPRSVVRFMVHLVNPQFGHTVFDPFCGTGGFLIEAFRHLSQQLFPTEDAVRILHHKSLYGQELTTTARIAKMNMILFGDGHSGVSQGDSLQPQAHNLYDCVLSNIPFSLELEDHEIQAVDARAKNSDEACLLRCFSSVKQGGSMAVVVPEGLVVNRTHKGLWKRIFSESRVRVIARLPRGTFAPYTEAGTNILYLTDKGTRKTEWYYRPTIDGEKARGTRIPMEDFLFFYQDLDQPGDAPDGVEIVRAQEGHLLWNIPDSKKWVPLAEVASITDGKPLTKLKAVPGPVSVIGGGRGVPAYTHNQFNTDGQCFTLGKSGAYCGYVWWHEYPIYASSDCMVVRSQDEDNYLTFYLYLCLKAKQEDIYGKQQGTGQPHFYKQHIVDFPIPRLSLSEQWEKIGESWEIVRQRVDSEKQETDTLNEAVSAVDAIYTGDAILEKQQSKPIYKAEYKGATPEHVGKALLAYRPINENASDKGCK